MKQFLQQRKGLVQGVFDKVYDKYDIMNDFMSLGSHRIWKKNFILSLNPSKSKSLIDVACGTGDIAKLYIKSTNEEAKIMCVDPNLNMINSLKKAIKYKKIRKVIVKNRNLRFKLPKNFEKTLQNEIILNVTRISKYIVIKFKSDTYCIFHLGMSGTIHMVKKKINKITNLSFYQKKQLPNKHNHIRLFFSNFKIIYNDPRRFGFF